MPRLPSGVSVAPQARHGGAYSNAGSVVNIVNSEGHPRSRGSRLAVYLVHTHTHTHRVPRTSAESAEEIGECYKRPQRSHWASFKPIKDNYNSRANMTETERRPPFLNDGNATNQQGYPLPLCQNIITLGGGASRISKTSRISWKGGKQGECYTRRRTMRYDTCER